MATINDGGPFHPFDERNDDGTHHCSHPGASLRDWFAGRALANATICTGEAPEWQLRRWFGDRGGITREEICARQAYSYADAMLATRKTEGA